MDAADYQTAVINHVMDNDMGFAIRAKMDGTVKETISGIQDCDWRPLVYRDGSESDTEQVCSHRTCDDTKRHKLLRWWCKESASMMMTTHSWTFSSTAMMKQWHGGVTFIVRLRPTWMS